MHEFNGKPCMFTRVLSVMIPFSADDDWEEQTRIKQAPKPVDYKTQLIKQKAETVKLQKAYNDVAQDVDDIHEKQEVFRTDNKKKD